MLPGTCIIVLINVTLFGQTRDSEDAKETKPPETSHKMAASFRAVMSGSGIAGMQREDVVAAIVRLTGKEPKDITCLYIGTAIYNDQRGAAQYLGLETAGCSITHLPMDATKADAEVLFSADVILVSGGNTLFAVDRWQHLDIQHLFASGI